MPKHISRKKGFTLIELLIVVGILGILAAGLLAAIDPIEQLKKGRDTTKRNIAVEFQNANTRYYAVQGLYPWGSGTLAGVTLSGASDYIATLVTAGELKSSFEAGLPGGAATLISVANPVDGGDVFVCFDPESKAISQDPSTQFSDTNGTLGCDPVASTACYWCAR